MFDRIIAPSLLAADFARLREAVQRVANRGADWLHLDISDGSFVPHISFGPALVNAIRPHTRLPFDGQLIVGRPGAFVDGFADAGANRITIHVETGSGPPDMEKAICDLRALPAREPGPVKR